MMFQVYDYGFSPHRGEGFKLAIHHHMDQPIMALSDVDISPGDNWIEFDEIVKKKLELKTIHCF